MFVPKRVDASKVMQLLNSSGLYKVRSRDNFLEITDLDNYSINRAYVEGGKLSVRIAKIYFNKKGLEYTL